MRTKPSQGVRLADEWLEFFCKLANKADADEWTQMESILDQRNISGLFWSKIRSKAYCSLSHAFWNIA